MLCYGMHLDFRKADAWSKIFIGAAIGLPIRLHEIVLKNGIHWLVPRDGDGP